MVAVPQDRFCPPGIYGRKNDTQIQRQGKTRGTYNFVLVCQLPTHAPPPLSHSNPPLTATTSKLLLVVDLLGWSLVGGQGRMVFDSWCPSVNRWLLSSADHHLCGQEEQYSNSGSRWRQSKKDPHTHFVTLVFICVDSRNLFGMKQPSLK